MLDQISEFTNKTQDRVAAILSDESRYSSFVGGIHLMLHWAENNDVQRFRDFNSEWADICLGIKDITVQAYLTELAIYVAGSQLSRVGKVDYIKLAQEFWDNGRSEVMMHIAAGEDEFKWKQLVYQELFMWARIGDKVTDEEFEFIITRRGFTYNMISFLERGLKYIGLR